MSSDTHQPSLAGLAAPQPTDRLFFAVMPPVPLAQRIAALAQELRERLALRGKPRPTSHLHVTLHHLGDFAGVPQRLVESACAAAAGVALVPFEGSFDRVGSFAGRAGKNPFVLLGNHAGGGMAGLHATLGTRLAAAGLVRRERAFVPHVTLLYDARTVAPQPVETLAWPVHEFLLIHSLLGRTEYRVLGRWPLAART
ncbi:MAG: RNA 2',3'-cyclic phosphodiesterase [Frateuria sp.]|uniref:RNA 2',3'-cyclic phosphodiesterase n=1 Tax=Frateuria sp. TaxID=2211372 RepID=UPI0017C51B7E|nr:RNA 2',3'-cyclic phosphodiesterase [Frateuria sp.]NUO73845.1 RNA 2',3'-cyclic phosphodiesterase [Frateuria sp.]NUR23165.1 RNA 2',3'-cyclic phosphodiesterase [Frateuria sp.]